jgi:hypothetical protein
MRPTNLALQYLASFFGDAPLEAMEPLLADDLVFEGPLYEFHSAKSYLDALKADPPENVSYQLLAQFENHNSACLIYRFIKPGIETPMAQTFDIANGKISKIRLIFDTKVFSED